MKEPYTFFLAGSLEKVFPYERPRALPVGYELSILRGEIPAVQLVYHRTAKTDESTTNQRFEICVEGAPVPVRMRSVELIPSEMPCYDRTDDDYLTTRAGLFPDLLKPMQDAVVRPLMNQYRSCWLDFPETEHAQPGTYEINIRLYEQDAADDGMLFSSSFKLVISGEKLPPQTLIHTEWFHGDCLADYYKTPVFSEEHWRILDNFIGAAADCGVNMLLTPIYTPPLDTAVGGRRTVIQLVEIYYNNGFYTFDFEKLGKWCAICRKYGIRYIEAAHLFSQWGADYAPQIMVWENEELVQKFGWHTLAISKEYRHFLVVFLPQLQAALESFGYDRDHVYYHISDEPGEGQAAGYAAAKAQVQDLLAGCPVIDALSDYTYYRDGLVERPIPANDHIQPFIEHGTEGLWTYYCCGQSYKVPNRFFAMPSARNRIMGVLMYRYKIEGFLHWGFNFYNSALSKEHIDPYYNSHASYAFPSGDAYLVYPGPDGDACTSIRAEVQRAGLDDMRALQLAEKYIGRKAVEMIIDEEAGFLMTFEEYPREAEFFYRLRKRINNCCLHPTIGNA